MTIEEIMRAVEDFASSYEYSSTDEDVIFRKMIASMINQYRLEGEKQGLQEAIAVWKERNK